VRRFFAARHSVLDGVLERGWRSRAGDQAIVQLLVDSGADDQALAEADLLDRKIIGGERISSRRATRAVGRRSSMGDLLYGDHDAT
jgi:hypothetical protein